MDLYPDVLKKSGKKLAAGLLLVLAILHFGCARQAQCIAQEDQRQAVAVHVVNHGRHTGLVLPNKELPDELKLLTQELNKHSFIEIGWGDADFYRADKVTPGIALKAIFLPSSSVLFIYGFNQSISAFYLGAEIYRIDLPREGFEKLCAHVSGSFQKGPDGGSVLIEPGRYANSYFYKSSLKYFFPRTCNTWTVKTLKAAGCPVSPAFAQTAGSVMKQIRKIGIPVSRER